VPAGAGNQAGANVSRASSRTFEDVKVGVRCKLAALWIAMLFLFAYGDIFGFFRPGQLQEVMAGELSGWPSPKSSCWRSRCMSRSPA
jgi:hypothetical protein